MYKLRPQGTRKSRKRIYNVSNKEPREQEIKCESTRIHMRGGRKEARGGCENIRKQRVLALQPTLTSVPNSLSFSLVRSLCDAHPARQTGRYVALLLLLLVVRCRLLPLSLLLAPPPIDSACCIYYLPLSFGSRAACSLSA